MEHPETPVVAEQPPRRRRWLRAALVTLAALSVLIALAPTIAQFGPLRSWILRQATPGLNGDISAEQASFGWFSPVNVSGLTIRDAEGATVIDVPELNFNSTLWTLVTGDRDLGRLRVRDLRVNVHVYGKGDTNLHRVFGGMRSQGNLLDRLRGRTLDIEIEDVKIRVRAPNAKGDWQAGDINFLGRLEPTGKDGAPQLLVRKCKLLDRTELTPGFCNDVLSFILPPMAGAASTEGAVSIDLNDGVIPLAEPRKLNVSGAVTIHDVAIGPGAITQSLTDFLATLKAPSKLKLANNSVVQFAVADEHVTHHGLEFGVPQVHVRTEGTVGFDRTLDLVAEVVLALGEDEKRPYLSALGNRNLRVPITGTFDEPKINFAAAAAGNANWVNMLQSAGTLWSQRAAASKATDGAERIVQDEAGTEPSGESSNIDVGELIDNLPIDELMKRLSERRERRAAEREAAAKQAEASGEKQPPPPRRRLLDRFRSRGPSAAETPPETQ